MKSILRTWYMYDRVVVFVAYSALIMWLWWKFGWIIATLSSIVLIPPVFLYLFICEYWIATHAKLMIQRNEALFDPSVSKVIKALEWIEQKGEEREEYAQGIR